MKQEAPTSISRSSSLKAVIEAHKRAQLDFDITAKIDKAYDDGYDAGYLQGINDWGNYD